jgi:hypothetical protein
LQNHLALAGLSAAMLSSAALASPTPGQYRIDAESTMSSGSGVTALQVTQRSDGATGRVTVIRKTAADTGPGATQTYPGSGPITWCVEPGGKNGPPAAALPAACQTLSHSSSSTGFSFSAACKGANIEESWRRIDERTWERSLKATVQAVGASAGDSARQLFEMSKHTMSAAERAKAQAELAALPSDAAIQAEMAPVIAQLEQQVRAGKPDEVAMAKQQLAALRGASGMGSPATSQTTTSRERWTRIAEACSARR